VIASMLAQSSGDTPAMVQKLAFLVPEMVLFAATVVVMIVGLSPNLRVRKSCAALSILGLIGAGIAAWFSPLAPHTPLPQLMPFAKVLIAGVGVLLIMLLTGTVDRAYESAVARGMPFDGIRSTRAEFYAFALFSLTGLMLCASADDLIWLFLALELTSLPTYVMVAISSGKSRAQEAGVKYFFLGAFGAAMFLYGFALLYGATGTTMLFGNGVEPGIMRILAENSAATGSIGTMALLGLIVALVGVSFKIAAVPMHFYTPDVYEGAATSVSAFLAFVPKAAGFIVLILLLSTVGWGHGEGGGLPEPVRVTLWVMAALSMTVGNVLAILQRSVKRMLAYSSIAHSGYMLVGVVVGPGSDPATGGLATNGLGAALFYLLCYGVMNLGAFAVLACLERRGGRDGESEIETVDDLRGLWQTHPLLAVVMVLCSLSLLGFPPLLGFVGKFYLFTAAISAGEIVLVIVMGINSAIAAFYYLRLVVAPFLENPDAAGRELDVTRFSGRLIAGVVSAASVLVLLAPVGSLMRASDRAGRPVEPGAAAGAASESADDASAPRLSAAER